MALLGGVPSKKAGEAVGRELVKPIRLPDSMTRSIAVAKPRLPQAIKSFATALMSPFSPDAIGAKVPDLYSFPTSSYHLKNTFTLGGASNFGVVCMPNPFVSLVDVSAGGSCVLTRGGAAQTSANTGVYGLTTEALLATVCTEFRMVGAGIKIRNLQAPLVGVGRIYVAVVPLCEGLPPVSFLNFNALSAAGYTAMLSNCGLPSPSLCTSSALQNLPLSGDYVVSDLVAGCEIDINHAVFHPAFYTMKAAITSSTFGAGPTATGDQLLVNSVGAVASLGLRDNMSVQGSAAIILYFEGFPSTASLALVEVDIIQHYETTPIIGQAAGVGLTPSPAGLPSVALGSTATVEAVITMANAPNNIIREIRNGLAAARDLDNVVTGGALTRLVNGPGRAAMSGMTSGFSELMFQ